MTRALGARYARIVALAGLAAIVTSGMFLGRLGDVVGLVNDVALLVMTLALGPVMATFYELGGRTPLRLAQASRASGIAAVLAWAGVQVLMVAGFLTFDREAPATGGLAVQALAVGVIGLWITGADLLAGPWLPAATRWLGVVTGIGVVAFAAGLLFGGTQQPLTDVGRLGYQVLLPAWGWLLFRLWRRDRAG